MYSIMKNLAPQRVAAVDVFRALTMFLMLFVNDIPGLKNIPHWLEHADINEDMMGFSDTIFPEKEILHFRSLPISSGVRWHSSLWGYFHLIRVA